MSQAPLLLNPTRVEAAERLRHADHLRSLAATEQRVAAVSREAEITVRALHESDRGALARLAGRDTADVPAGHALGAEMNGALVAALSLEDGRVIADPFSSTSSAIELLRLRARQLGVAGRRHRLPRLRRRAAMPRARGALAGSPPGGANLLEL